MWRRTNDHRFATISRCSTGAKKASMSTWKMMWCMRLAELHNRRDPNFARSSQRNCVNASIFTSEGRGMRAWSPESCCAGAGDLVGRSRKNLIRFVIARCLKSTSAGASAVRVPLLCAKTALIASLCVRMGNPSIRLGALYPSVFQSNSTRTEMVASLGFEPRQADSESAVLPLHHEAVRGGDGRRGVAVVKCGVGS